MKLEYDKELKKLKVDNQDQVLLTKFSNSPNEVLTTVLGYRGRYIGSSNLIITKEVLEKEYEPVEDFKFIEFLKKSSTFVEYYQLYKNKKQDYFILIDIDLSTDYGNDSEEYVKGTFKVDSFYFKGDSCEGVCDSLSENLIHNKNSAKKISIVLKTMSGFTFKEHSINPLSVDVNTMYNDDFKSVSDHIVDSLLTKNKGVVLLHGKAGTGKSNYIKHLTTLVPEKKFVFIPISVIPHLTDPSFLGELIDNKGSILVLEDCENYIKDRDKEGNNGIVSTILNLSDGLLSDVLETQIICTFNTNLNNIDSALLRKGRLISEYKFEKLSKDKTSKLLKSLNVEDAEDIESEMTLSEVFNAKDNSHRTKKKQTKIGFR